MKKLIVMITVTAFLLILTASVSAKELPERLLSEDGAEIFIGITDSYTLESENALSSVLEIKTATVTPVLAIKGKIEAGESKVYESCDFGALFPEKNREYLFCCAEDNILYMYEIISRDESSVKLASSDDSYLIKRIEDYINDGAFAMAEKERSTLENQKSFMEFLYQIPTLSSSGVEKVTLRYQDELHEVNKDKFFEIAQDIMITNVKNDTLYDIKVNPNSTDAYKTVLYIELMGANNELIYFAAVSRFGEVDRYALMLSRLMAKDYQMKPEDVSRLYSLLPDNVQKNMVTPEKLPDGDTLMIDDTSANSYTGIAFGGAAVIFLIAFLTAYILRRRKI